MRIISGKFKGKRLTSFRGRHIRPTSDKVREAIFNILPVEWDGKEVLDLFAGTGALGIESLSRGAQKAVFVEHHFRAVKILEKNIKALLLDEQIRLLKLHVDEGLNFIKRSAWKFDIAFLDPPYSKGLTDNILHLIADSEVMKENGIVVVEHHDKEQLSERYQKLQMDGQRKYGNTKVSFFIAVDK